MHYDGGMTTKTVADDVDPLSLERQVCFALAITNRAVLAVYRPLLEPLRLIQPQYLSLAGTTTDMGGLTVYQTPGNVRITAQPGPAAQNAAQQATYFPVSDLPRA
jgi:hypothetical protein